MWGGIALGVGGFFLAVIALLVVFVASMRMKFRPVQDAVRRLNRVTLNRRSMRTAGRRGAYASVIRHAGRKSGTQYETPVAAAATKDGFAIALPYGTRSDWLKNVLAAESAVLVHEGDTYLVDHPELVSAAVARHHFPPGDQRSHRFFSVGEILLLRRSTPA